MRLNIAKIIGKSAFVASVLATNMYTCTNGFQPPYKMQDRIVSTIENPTGKQVNNPKLLVVDCFEVGTVNINNDDTPDIPHGEVVSKLLEENLPNADVYKRNVDFTNEGVSAFTEKLDTLFSGILKRGEKFDAINMSLGSDISFKTLSELLGFEITPDNIARLKGRVRDSLATSKYIVNGDPFYLIAKLLNKMDSVALNGSKIYVAAGNEGSTSLNLLSLANGMEVVGACDEFATPKDYSADNSIITRYARDEFPVEATKDGFDITMDGKTDFKFEQMAFPWFATKQPREIPLHGTSFAAPNAIIEDLEAK